MKDDKADTPSSDTSPRGKKGARKGIKRKNKNDPITPQPAMQPTMQVFIANNPWDLSNFLFVLRPRNRLLSKWKNNDHKSYFYFIF